MKLFLNFLLIINFTIFSQEQYIGVVEYNKIINNPNGTSFATPFKLYFDNQTSIFYRVDDAVEITEKTKEESVDSQGRMVSSTVMKSNLPNAFYYTNVSSGDLIFRETVAQKLYLIKDSIEPISWKLHNERKKIGDYTCQKATAPFRGREYTVWFTTEIPISHGPWKLRGLPGLILEASEASGKYVFKATKFNMKPDISEIKEKLKKPDTNGLQNMAEYKKALKEAHKEMRAKILASLPRGAKILEGCDRCPDPNNRNLERFE